METGAPFYVNLPAELEDYLKQNPAEIPDGIDSHNMWVLGDMLLISDIENYSESSPYRDTFKWEVQFGKRGANLPQSEYELSKHYTYIITYTAVLHGKKGIIKATLQK